MTNAAIYCRVSTDSQEREGTSLQTQLENCLTYCQGKGYDVSHRFAEAYSGLSLERPELDKLRELVRAEQIDVVVCYSLDRLTRDPGHGVIITQELEKHHVTLEAVTEDVDNTELGKLISYIRGFASKLEAEKIRERTIRGKRAKAKMGFMPGGSGTKLYGYDYIRVSQENGGRRVINETEASWVRQMFEWLVNEALSSNQILFRLRAHNAPTRSGKIWTRSGVQSILTNPAFAGKTFAFTTIRGHSRFTRPEADWIEIPGATPAIISQELFDAAQNQLRINKEKSPRNRKRQYLLGGHLKCRQCGHSYVSAAKVHKSYAAQRYYRCKGTLRQYVPVDRCHNKSWSAKKLEAMVWAELERYLSQPELIIGQLEAQRQDAGQLGIFEAELGRVERQLKAVDREQHQLLQWALKDFPADQVEAENRRLNKAKETLTAEKAGLEAKIKASQDAVISLPQLESFIEAMRSGMAGLDFEAKRQALDILGITVWLDGETVAVTGVIELEQGVLVPTQSSWPGKRVARPSPGLYSTPCA
ncbi:MAG: recombinase family protein, partial [Chloroflexi bacterium]|nr:recombinase family protein [Chloroflexota bacterium]